LRRDHHERRREVADLIDGLGIVDAETGEWVDVGLPFGPKPRLILCYLNTQAILSKSPLIEVESSLSAFVERIGLDRHGRNMRTVKGQFARLAAADFKFGTPG
jgi:hypothetical protein